MSDERDPLVGFDQTNGLLDDAEGESDGTAAGDDESAADRDFEDHPRPVGAQDTFMTDHYGDDYGKDPNP